MTVPMQVCMHSRTGSFYRGGWRGFDSTGGSRGSERCMS